jgi:O-antigen/teichoic acid export membrane protein
MNAVRHHFEVKRISAIRIAPYAVSNMLSGIASLLSIIIFSRLLSAEGYGQFTVVLAMVSVCQTAVFSWIQASITRLLPDQSDHTGYNRFAECVRFGFILSATIVAFAWMVAVAAFKPLPDQMVMSMAGLSVLLCNAWASAGQAWNRVTERPWRFSMSLSVQAFGGLAFAMVGLAWQPGEPLVPLAAVGAASLLAALIAHIPLAGGSGGLRVIQPQLRRMLAYAGPLTAVSLVWVILAAADRLLIASILGPAAAGAYSIAASLASRAVGLLLLPISLSTRSLVFVEFGQRGAEAATELLQKVANWLMAVGLPVTILLVCAPQALTSAIIGDQLAAEAAEVLPWTAIGALLAAFLTYHFVLGFQVTHRTNWTFYAVAPAAAFDILSNILLLPRFGIVAAGWSMVGSYVVALTLTIRFGKKHFRVPFSISDALRTAAACVPLYAFLQLEFQNTFSGLVCMLGGGALIYAASALALDVAASRTHLTRWLRS